MKNIISTEVTSALSQLAGSDNKSDGEGNKNLAQESSTNANKKVCLKSIPKKAKRG